MAAQLDLRRAGRAGRRTQRTSPDMAKSRCRISLRWSNRHGTGVATLLIAACARITGARSLFIDDTRHEEQKEPLFLPPASFNAASVVRLSTQRSVAALQFVNIRAWLIAVAIVSGWIAGPYGALLHRQRPSAGFWACAAFGQRVGGGCCVSGNIPWGAGASTDRICDPKYQGKTL